MLRLRRLPKLAPAGFVLAGAFSMAGAGAGAPAPALSAVARIGQQMFRDPALSGSGRLSCASCHEENYGNYIRADHLSQGQIQGFPTYRLKNAGVVSIHNRFKGCIRDTRAETYSPGSDEFRNLELYVASRGLGLDIEGGGVRP